MVKKLMRVGKKKNRVDFENGFYGKEFMLSWGMLQVSS